MGHRNALRTAIAVLGFALSAGGCAFGEFRPDDPFDRQLALENAHRDYTHNVRWSRFDVAAKYVDPELRDEFLARAPKFKDFRFTDWEAEPFQLDAEKRHTTIQVTYYGYRMSSLTEVPVSETQEWYREGRGLDNPWFVRPRFLSGELGLVAAEAR